MPSQHFTDLLKKMDEVHQRKNHDYAQDSDPFSNFTRASELISWFKNPIDQVFAGIIGIKLARLAELLNGKEPKNESLDDNMLDLANYCGLWAAMKLRDREEAESNRVEFQPGMNKLNFIPSETTISNEPISLNRCLKLPTICANCEKKSGWADMISHAIDMHGAEWNCIQRTLKYPSHELYLFPINYEVGKYESISTLRLGKINC